MLYYGPGNMPLFTGSDICDKIPFRDILNVEDYGLRIDGIQENIDGIFFINICDCIIMLIELTKMLCLITLYCKS